MADLFHLDDELNEPQEDEAEQLIDNAPDPVDNEEEDREIIDLPLALAQAARQTKSVEPPPADDDRLDLQDFFFKGHLPERQEYSRLQHWWIQELQAPQLLPWDGGLVGPMLEAAFAEDEENNGSNTTNNNNLEAILNDIRRVDKERVQFIVANLLQVRLRKIQACPWFYLNEKECLSNGESLFLDDFHKLLEGHLQTTVTDHFPQEAWRRLDEPEMIEQPNLNQYVMVRVRQDSTLRKGSEEARTLEEGSNLIVNYNEIRTFLESGAVQLIM